MFSDIFANDMLCGMLLFSTRIKSNSYYRTWPKDCFRAAILFLANVPTKWNAGVYLNAYFKLSALEHWRMTNASTNLPYIRSHHNPRCRPPGQTRSPGSYNLSGWNDGERRSED